MILKNNNLVIYKKIILLYNMNHHKHSSIEWGHSLWKFIHAICIIDKETPQNNAKESRKVIKILKSIKNIIPCEECKQEWKKHIHTLYTLDIYKPMELFHWSWQFHNKINKKINKPIITYDDALRIHTKIN